VRIVAVFVLLLTSALAAGGQRAAGDKASRTPAQRKIDSQLLQEIERATSAPNGPRTTAVKIDRRSRALVDVRADVTQELQRTVRRLGGSIVSTSPAYRSVIAWVPLLKLEELAAGAPVQAISPASQAVIHK